MDQTQGGGGGQGQQQQQAHHSSSSSRGRGGGGGGGSSRASSGHGGHSHSSTGNLRGGGYRSQQIGWGSEQQQSFDDDCVSPSPIVALFSLMWRAIAICLTLLSVTGLSVMLSLLYVCVRPFSRRTYRRLACTLGASSFVDAVALLMPNVKLSLTGDSDVPSPIGTSVLVSNHVLEGDFWIMLMLGRCIGLRGSMKVFLRHEIFADANANAGGGGGGGGGSARSISGTDICHTASSASSSSSSGCTNGHGGPTNGVSAGSSGEPVSGGNGVHHHGASSSATASPTLGQRSRPCEGGDGSRHPAGAGELVPSPTRSLSKFLLRTLLEFPSLSAECGSDYVKERDELFQLLRDFAENERSFPVHLLLLPEGWSDSVGGGRLGGIGWREEDLASRRKLLLAKSLEFAKREGRPQLKHLLLPRTTGFNASLESLRASSPDVYDVTIAYLGYDGTVPISVLDLSWPTLWKITSRQMPSEIHVRIKRYSMEEVLQDPQWLDKKWAEKDRLLGHFFRHQQFPPDSRGFCRLRSFNTRWYSVEGSLIGLARLSFIPFCIPFLLLISLPVAWALIWLWIVSKTFKLMFPDVLDGGFLSFLFGDDPSIAGGVHPRGGAPAPGNGNGRGGDSGRGDNGGGETTPCFPATPFASPIMPLGS